MNPDYQKLLQRVEALEKWKAQKERQQISYPLDVQSQTILQKYFMSISQIYDFIVYGVAENAVRRFIGKQGNYAFEISPQSLFPYQINISTNELTVIGERFANDTAVMFTTNDTLPAPLAGTTTYYVISTSSDQQTFEVSLTVGGAPVDITNIGTGAQYIYKSL